MEFSSNTDFLKRRTEFYQHKTEEVKHGSRDFIFKERVSIFVPKDGQNVVRILPPMWDGAMHYGIDIFAHYKVGTNNSTFLCPEQMKQGPCPICDENRAASRRNDKATQDATRYQHRVLTYVINRSAESEGPLAWTMPFAKIAKELILQCDPLNGTFIFIDDPVNGRDVIFNKSGKDLLTKYEGVRPNMIASPLSSDQAKANEWLKFVTDKPLPSLLDFKSADHIKKVFLGEDVIVTEPIKQTAMPTASETLMSQGAATALKQQAEQPKQSAPAPGAALSKSAINSMNADQLKDFIQVNQLGINPSDYSDSELKQAIMLEIGID